jgi:hypothetical protein
MGIVAGAGDVVVQPPLGFGFGFKLAFYPVRAGPMRFGFTFNGGHDRFMSRRVIVSQSMTDRGMTVSTPRWSVLTHTDIALGLGFQVPAGPLLFELGGGGGLGVSSYRRAVSVDVAGRRRDGGVQPAGPRRRERGHPDPQQSRARPRLRPAEVLQRQARRHLPDAPRGAPPDSVVFDLILNVTLAYQMWF